MDRIKELKRNYSSPEFLANYVCEDKKLGMNCSEKGTEFLLWSPYAKSVRLHLYQDGEDAEAFQEIEMAKEERGIWAYRTEKSLHGVYYDYTILHETGQVTLGDPYARACGVNWNRSMAVDLQKTNPEGWEQDAAPAKDRENIIYELHVKEFSWHESGGFPEEYRGKYKAFTCENTTLHGEGKEPTGIAYLKELGVTHIQLMPAFDYASVDEKDDKQFNWGYDPMNYNVPEGSYATSAEQGEVRIREFKEMVQSLHKNGFRVVMDVVYNHTYSRDSNLNKAVPWYYYRTDAEGNPSNGSACGNDIASERPMCSSYILDSVLYWAEEYHIDGFRFDLMGLLDVKLMNRIQEELDKRYGVNEKIIYGEPWAATHTCMEKGAHPALKDNVTLLDEKIGIFCDDTRDTVKGDVFIAEKPGFVNGGMNYEKSVLEAVRGWQNKDIGKTGPSRLITYVSAHDNLTLWDKLQKTTVGEELCLKRNRLAAAVYMTCQGNLFFLSGEEFARTKNGEDNSYNMPIELNCLDWDRSYQYRELKQYYQGLIALRKKLPCFCDKTDDAGKRIGHARIMQSLITYRADNYSIEYESDWQEIFVIYNARETMEEIRLPEGEWQLLLDGENSFWWMEKKRYFGNLSVPGVSAMILGKISAGEEKKI